jgi:LuxR family maltose regulon positive regulatory protein
MKTRLQIADGDLPSAASWAHDRDLSVGDDPDYLREYEHLTLARLLLARHRAEQRGDHAGSASPVAAVLRLLDRLHTAAAEAGRGGSVLEIRMLQVLAHHAHGNLPQALAALSRAMGEASEPESYVRLYLDEGAPMVALLRQAASATDPASEHTAGEHGEAARGQALRLLEQAQTHVEGSEQDQSLVDPLSQRELEVLRLLGSELTGPEIARELYVTLNTLRTHTKRIFTKLDAKTRASAVHHARERGLL